MTTCRSRRSCSPAPSTKSWRRLRKGGIIWLPFLSKVMTIDHCFFEGDVDRIVVRTSQGDVGILPNHVPYIAALGIGALTIIQNGEKRIAAIAGGFVDVTKRGHDHPRTHVRMGGRDRRQPSKQCSGRARAAIQKKGERARIRGGSGQAEKGAEPYPYCRRQVNMKKVLWERLRGLSCRKTSFSDKVCSDERRTRGGRKFPFGNFLPLDAQNPRYTPGFL